jgi:UDP-2,3-diacylglucosamine pyrophosphatase LpxH
LGSPVCRTECLKQLLVQEKWSKIIINGDLIDHGHFGRFSKRHWEVLKLLRKLSKNIEITLVQGNHDRDSSVLCEILGLDFVLHYSVVVKDQIVWFEHGDRFDTFVSQNPLISKLAGALYDCCQRLDGSLTVSRWLKKQSKTWLQAATDVAQKALAFAEKNNIQHIVCGHVHFAGTQKSERATYWNTGSFCESPSYYLQINKQEEISLKIFSE